MNCVVLLSIGLVLATELSTAIHPLNEIGSVSLRCMNDYLTSVTGIHLNYDLIPEDPPPPMVHVRTPTRFNSIPREYSLQTPQQQQQQQQDRDWRTKSREDFKDSSKREGCNLVVCPCIEKKIGVCNIPCWIDIIMPRKSTVSLSCTIVENIF